MFSLAGPIVPTIFVFLNAFINIPPPFKITFILYHYFSFISSFSILFDKIMKLMYFIIKLFKFFMERMNFMLKEFKEFATRGNISDLALGIVIGGAFQKL